MLAFFCLATRGVKSQHISWHGIVGLLAAGICLFFFNDGLLTISAGIKARTMLYAATLLGGYLLMLTAGVWISRLMRHDLLDDPYNDENESFMQETRLIENEYSINLPTRFRYRGCIRQG